MQVDTNNSFPDQVDAEPLESVIDLIVSEAGYDQGSISLAVVDDPTIHRVNRQFLEHDYETDVLSFVLDRHDDYLEGEVIVSYDTALRLAPEIGWTPAEELLLYAIHGALHLIGMDDHSPEDEAEMRLAERKYLRRMGVTPVDSRHSEEAR